MPVKLEMQENALFTLHEAVVQGVATMKPVLQISTKTSGIARSSGSSRPETLI